MTPQEREQFKRAGDAFPGFNGLVDTLDWLTAAGFSISLDSVRDHTNCLAKPWACGGTGTIDGTRGGEPASWPCTDARPVVWSAEA